MENLEDLLLLDLLGEDKEAMEAAEGTAREVAEEDTAGAPGSEEGVAAG